MSEVRTPSSQRTNAVWVVLSVLTLGSWGLAMIDRGGASTAVEVVGVLTFAAVKGRLIVRDFMEVRDAPRWLRNATDAWLLGLWATAIVMTLAA